MSQRIYRAEGFTLQALPAGVERPADGDVVVMSAEIDPSEERGGDLVRVKGMKVPDGIPLQAQHLRFAPDGSPVTIGKVVASYDAEIEWGGRKVAAKLGAFKWAPTELAAKYKQLWPEYINKVSIGAFVRDGCPLDPKNPFGGYEYTETELFELSVVTIPANPAAGVLRQICQTLDMIEPEPTPAYIEELSKRLERIESLVVGMSEAQARATADRNGQSDMAILRAASSLRTLRASLK